MLIACPACHRQYDVGDLRPGTRVRCRCGELCPVPESRPRQAEMLCCSHCGADLEPERANCGYCGAAVDPEGAHVGDPCPECLARVRPGAKFCTHCGVELRPEAVVRAVSERGCPRCEVDLLLVEAGDVAFHECGSCDGLWLDHAMLDRLVARKRVEAKRYGGESPRLSKATRVPRDTRYTRCPVCKRYMHPQHFARYSGVLVDLCPKHGFWFDSGELDRVAEFVAEGGLEAADRKRSEENRRRRSRARIARVRRRMREARQQRSGGARDLIGTLGLLLGP